MTRTASIRPAATLAALLTALALALTACGGGGGGSKGVDTAALFRSVTGAAAKAAKADDADNDETGREWTTQGRCTEGSSDTRYVCNLQNTGTGNGSERLAVQVTVAGDHKRWNGTTQAGFALAGTLP